MTSCESVRLCHGHPLLKQLLPDISPEESEHMLAAIIATEKDPGASHARSGELDYVLSYDRQGHPQGCSSIGSCR